MRQINVRLFAFTNTPDILMILLLTDKTSPFTEQI
jgi:hypothetical protein